MEEQRISFNVQQKIELFLKEFKKNQTVEEDIE
jgi:hypothetical protein